MKTLPSPDLIRRALRADSPMLDSFADDPPGDLPLAVHYRLAHLAARGGSFEREFTEDELSALVYLHPETMQRFTEWPGVGDPWSYLLFADGSLYFANNGADEVWADATDFITLRLWNDGRGADYSLDSAEYRLIERVVPDLVEG